MVSDLFDEPRAKLARARKHLDDLLAAETAFNATEPVTVEAGDDGEGNAAILLRASSFPDLQCSAIAGDVLNNLRASLDLSVNAACRVNGKKSLSKTYFPIISDEGDWRDVTSGKHNRMKAATPAIKKLAKSFKPWKAGNPTLHALSRLVGLDKHQALISLAVHHGGIQIDGLRVKSKSGGPSPMHGRTFLRLTPEQPTDVLFTSDADTEISITGPNRVRVLFGFEATDIKPYVGAIQLLNDMGSICEKIVETFAAASAKGELA